MRLDLKRVQNNVKAATTEDLIDRVTVYRASLDPGAIPVIVEELMSRGVSAEEIARHDERAARPIVDASGAARPCSRCRKPAAVREWRWHRIFGIVPLFPRVTYSCEDHRRPVATP